MNKNLKRRIWLWFKSNEAKGVYLTADDLEQKWDLPVNEATRLYDQIVKKR